MGAAAVFVARNRFAVLDKATNNILVKNLRNEVTKQCASPLPVTDSIFYAGTGLLLCRCDDKVSLSPSLPLIGSGSGLRALARHHKALYA